MSMMIFINTNVYTSSFAYEELTSRIWVLFQRSYTFRLYPTAQKNARLKLKLCIHSNFVITPKNLFSFHSSFLLLLLLFPKPIYRYCKALRYNSIKYLKDKTLVFDYKFAINPPPHHQPFKRKKNLRKHKGRKETC